MALQATKIGRHAPGIFTHTLTAYAQVTATQADEAIGVMPFDCTVIAGVPNAGVAGGTTNATDLDLMIENATTDLFATVVPAWDSSTRVVTAVAAAAANASVDQGAVLHLDTTVTGGTSPTFDGVSMTLICKRR